MKDQTVTVADGPQTVKRQGSILIVDDEQLVRKALSRYLLKMGYSIDTAEDGNVAIAKLESEPYDLVLTDLKMPNLDGRELLTAMSEKFPDIPKIVLTGFGTNDDIILALKTGAYDFLTKPIMDFAILYHAIERALDRKRLNDEKNRYVEQLSQINDIITMLNRGKKTEEIFMMLNSSLRKIIPFDRLSLLMIDEITGEVVAKLVESDREKEYGGMRNFSLGDSLLKEVALGKEVAIISDLDEYLKSHPLSRRTRSLIEEGLRSSMMVPLIINNVTRGFLVFNSMEAGAFNSEHSFFIRSISGQISFSIQRAELLDQLEQ